MPGDVSVVVTLAVGAQAATSVPMIPGLVPQPDRP
jgi:hypothetical protein